MKRANYDSLPLAIEAVGNGSFYYRWDIEEEQVELQTSDESEEAITATKWNCYEVVVWATLTADKITEAVIDALWGNGVEQKLLNDYNAYKLGVLGSEAETAYKEFINERDRVKSEVYAVCVEFNIEKNIVTLESAKSAKLKDIEVYDKSSEVNSFSVGEDSLWIDRETRSSLFFSTTLEKEAGAETSTLYYGESEYTYPIDSMLAMLSAVELYAKACYKVTQQHILAVSELESIEAVEEYDITANYPDKLTF